MLCQMLLFTDNEMEGKQSNVTFAGCPWLLCRGISFSFEGRRG